jgi:putative acetyltransferase
MKIRSETPQDIHAIEQVTFTAFDRKPYSNQTEHLIVNALRASGALSVALVAEENARVIGHAAFSVVTIDGEDKGWYALGPISILPEFQRQGIGSKLIEKGLSMLRESGAQGCVLEGSPAYYHRFGFKAYPALTYDGAPSPEYFMALPFTDAIPEGQVEFHQAFYVNAG